MGDRPTPRSIGVCALIALRSDPSSPLHEIEFNPHEQDKMTTLLEDAVFAPVAPLCTWVQKLRDAVGFEVAELLMDTLYMASESVDSLVDLMDSLRAGVVEGLVDAVSVHGVYLRQVCLGYEQLSFESVALLWQELCDQLDRVPDLRAQETTMFDGPQDDVYTWPLSMKQVEEMLQQSCRKLDETQLSFERVELQVRSMLQKAPQASASYFLRFLNCLRCRDRLALEALHHFFDHTAIQKQTSTKEVLQFSAVLLALVHDSFGDQGLALVATEEAVRVAQQSKDKTCVAFALGKLFQNRGQGASDRRELLKRCAKRAAQEQIRPLLMGSSVRLGLDYLEEMNRNPLLVWQHYTEATAEPAADGMSSRDRPTCLFLSPLETYQALSRQSLVESGIWDAIGCPVLSILASMVTLNCHHVSTSEERTLALANLTRLLHHSTPSSVSSSPSYLRESNAISKFHQARKFHHLGEKSSETTNLPPLILKLHKLCLDKRYFELGELLEIQLRSSLPPGSPVKDKFLVDIGIQSCVRMCQSQNWAKARSLASGLLQPPCVELAHRTELLLLLSAMGIGSTVDGFLAALPHLLEGISVCDESKVHDSCSVASLTLAQLFLRMQNPKRALSILKASIPQMMQRAHISYQAKAFMTQAKCHIQMADAASTSFLKEKRYRTALCALETSQRQFQQIENNYCLVEVLYLKARILFLMHRAEECEVASEEYMYLQKRELHGLGRSSSLLPVAAVVSC